MATIEIDGKTLTVDNGTTIIKAADDNGIYIPRFCYHKKLSVAANCRMCLVEVEKAPKALPACATPVAEGMRVFTRSPSAIDAQKAVMEFLLINHPLDCPVCDQGGQCELQDLAMGYGSDASEFKERKRAVKNKELGPLISTEMTRCIHCTRCVRFGDEIAGLRELGLVHRGNHEEIDTYVKHTMQSELSGNIIDICPVGALTSKPFRFRARTWEMTQHASVAPHDCVGSNIHLNTQHGKTLRVLPRSNEMINESWLSDRDRFSYTGLYHENRLEKPMIKRQGKWEETDWETAFDRVVKGFSAIMRDMPDLIGALVSPNATTEEAYLTQKLMRALGSQNIDHRIKQVNVDDQDQAPLHSTLGVSFTDLEKRDAILLLGSNIRQEQPIAGLRVRKASLHGAHVYALNMIDHAFNFKLSGKAIVEPAQFLNKLAEVTKAALEMTGKTIPASLQSIHIAEDARLIAQGLINGKASSIILGAFALSHPYAATICSLAKLLAQVTNSTVGELTPGANSQGAAIAGALPHREAMGQPVKSAGFAVNAMFDADLAGYLLVNLEPERDCAAQQQALAAMKQAGFVVALTPYVTETMKIYADVLLPIATLGETSGTFVNIEGQWQSFSAAHKAPGEARPAWKILRVLGNLFELPGFDYLSSADVLTELRSLETVTHKTVDAIELPDELPVHAAGLQLIMEVPMYATDSLLRHAEPLSKLLGKQTKTIRLHEETIKQQGLAIDKMADVTYNDKTITVKVMADKRLPLNTALLSAAVGTTAGFGSSYATIEVKQ